MIIAGLTGSIGMGKTTTADMFRDQGIPVYDADLTVHELYSSDAVPIVEAEFPGVAKDGKIDRTELATRVLNNPEALEKLESLVHPLVHQKQTEFLKAAENDGHSLVILDIPLLFEAGGYKNVDKIIVVTASKETQRERVMARPDMTEEKFQAILAKQLPDAEKRNRADFIIDTGNGMESAFAAVQKIIAELT